MFNIWSNAILKIYKEVEVKEFANNRLSIEANGKRKSIVEKKRILYQLKNKHVKETFLVMNLKNLFI